jgi:hypothetical protein
LRIPRGLRKSIVEAASPRASDMREHTIESDPSILVGVESMVQKIAQESSILRNSFADHSSRGVMLSGVCFTYEAKSRTAAKPSPATTGSATA